jgi:putative peptidoglycan lipid II flippase
VFYALGDGTTPFRWSLAGIGLNAFFDWFLVGGPTPWGLQLPALNFGAPGLVLATVSVNVITCLGLLQALRLRLGVLPLRRWARDTALLLVAATLGALVAWLLSERLPWPAGLGGLLFRCGLGSAMGTAVYGLVASGAGVPEVQDLLATLRRRLPGRA